MSNTPNPGARARFSATCEAATLAGWRADFLAGGQDAPKSRPADDRDEQIARVRAKLGDRDASATDSEGVQSPAWTPRFR